MTEPGPDHGDDDILAAEYVLGVLAGSERARAAERLASDDAFRAQAQAWEQRLAPLFDEVAPRRPPARLWRRIARSVEDRDNVVLLRPRRQPWTRTGFWQATTAASLAAAAAFAFYAVRPSQAPAPTQAASGKVLAATMAAADGRILYVATLDGSRRGVTVVPVSEVASQGRTVELWIIPVGGKPAPVGLLAGRGATSAPASSAVLAKARAKAVLAVSLEPPGGSPTGAPTGPVIASGALEAL